MRKLQAARRGEKVGKTTAATAETLLLVEVKAAAVVKVVGIESCGWSVNESGSKAVASLVILCR